MMVNFGFVFRMNLVLHVFYTENKIIETESVILWLVKYRYATIYDIHLCCKLEMVKYTENLKWLEQR